MAPGSKQSALQSPTAPADDTVFLQCVVCGDGAREVVVKYGSYVLRCAKCGKGIVATSFLAMRDRSASFAAYLDQGHGQVPEACHEVAAGPLFEIYPAVAGLAREGKSILLIPKGCAG